MQIMHCELGTYIYVLCFSKFFKHINMLVKSCNTCLMIGSEGRTRDIYFRLSAKRVNNIFDDTSVGCLP